MTVLRVDASGNGGSVTVSSTDNVEVVLPEQAGTGYRWELEPLPDGVTLIEDRVEPGMLPGAGGLRIFTLATELADEARVRAKLRRGWEPPEQAVDWFAIRLVP